MKVWNSEFHLRDLETAREESVRLPIALRVGSTSDRLGFGSISDSDRLRGSFRIDRLTDQLRIGFGSFSGLFSDYRIWLISDRR
jgi:hypothetical protein